MSKKKSSKRTTSTIQQGIWAILWLAVVAVVILVVLLWSGAKQDIAIWLLVLSFAGAVSGQAKDIALSSRKSRGHLRDILRPLKQAFWDDKQSAPFFFRLLEWGALAIAAALLAGLIVPSGTELTATEDTKLTAPLGTALDVEPGTDLIVPSGTYLTVPPGTDLTDPSGTNIPVPR